MRRRDFIKITATGLLALATPLAFSATTSVENTLEGLGFKKTIDLLKVQVGSFSGESLKRQFEVYQTYSHEKGTLKLQKYTKGKGVHICEFEHPWVITWTPYKKGSYKFETTYVTNEQNLVDMLQKRAQQRWGIQHVTIRNI